LRCSLTERIETVTKQTTNTHTILKRLCCLLFLLFTLPLCPVGSLAQEAIDVTRDCRIYLNGGSTARKNITDKKYMTVWVGNMGRESTIRIELPKHFDCGGLYLCWGTRPDTWTLYQNDQEVAQSDDSGFAHEYVEVKGGGGLRLVMQANESANIILGELFVLQGHTPPDWVQRWQPTYETADLMVLVAHPDDELLFMGGTIPYYERVRNKRVVVCYLTCANNMRQSELLNGLWSMGIRNYPVIGQFRDKNQPTMKKMYDFWGKNEVEDFVVELVRKYKPKVLISHDVNGEYGHSAHRVCSELAVYAFHEAGKKSVDPKSTQEFGTWEISKLYLHLHEENPIVMDWKTPHEKLDGQTPLKLAEAAFKLHRSQNKNHQMGKNNKYDSSKFGLAGTRVGNDIQKNDFFENVPEE
jgi:LmbE family N-acetylglucosaminyl deacetylase